MLKSSNNFTNVTLPPEAADENQATFTLRHKIYIENYDGGAVSIIDLDNVHTVIGSVLRPGKLAQDSSAGFWASHYDKGIDGSFSCVTAIGTNAMHLRVGPMIPYDPFDPYAWMPKQISIGLKEDYDHSGGSYSDRIIYTSIPGGSQIFGGNSSPYVGNPVLYFTENETWESLDLYYNNDYSKEIPKRLMIEVYEAQTINGNPEYIEFENWAAGDIVGGESLPRENNGRITIHYPNGVAKHIADVIQRVQGTGRFAGSEYSEVGRIRAAHPGVIDFSTSPYFGFTNNPEVRGGLQFVPANHAKFLSYDLGQDSFIGKDQWGIVAYIGATPEYLYNTDYIIDGHISYDPIWEGVPPLFAEFIHPHHDPTSQENSAYFVVSEDFGATWSPCPEIVGVTTVDNSPVANWTNIRAFLK